MMKGLKEMDKETILEMSRKENKNKDIAELDAINKAGRIAAAAGMIICMIISLLDWHITKTINCGCWAVNFGILTTLFTAKYIILKKKHELFAAIGYFVIFAFFCWGYVMSLINSAV